MGNKLLNNGMIDLHLLHPPPLTEPSALAWLSHADVLHSAVKGSISLLYIKHPQDPTVTCCTTCRKEFPWNFTWGAALGSDWTNGFWITLNFKEHTYQLPKDTVKMSCSACKLLFTLPAGEIGFNPCVEHLYSSLQPTILKMLLTQYCKCGIPQTPQLLLFH